MTIIVGMADPAPAPEKPLVDKVYDVIKGIQEGKVHPKHVDELGRTVDRSKQDRAVNRTFGHT